MNDETPMRPSNNSIFWIEVEKIRPNPYQPRKEFDEHKLGDLAESIRQYGVLQPLVVTRHEVEKDDGGIAVEYELIAGERRWRASKLAGVSQVPSLIRDIKENDQIKLELAIIENVQREDLTPIERARAFSRLVQEFNFKHSQIAKRVSKSREYISNTLRLLTLPEEMQEALGIGKISEGHARSLMMLSDKSEEQTTLFKEVLAKKLTVRDTENIARRIARDRLRKKNTFNPELLAMEESLTERLGGARVHIEERETGGKITIDFASPGDLKHIATAFGLVDEFRISSEQSVSADEEADLPLPEERSQQDQENFAGAGYDKNETASEPKAEVIEPARPFDAEETPAHETVGQAEEKEADKKTSEEDLYNIRNFSI